MSDKTLKNEARNYYVPYLLGNSKKAHGLSLRIYKKFGIISVICDSRRSFWDILDPTSMTALLAPTDSSRLISEQLLSLTDETFGSLPLLIPMSEEYARSISCERETLERRFIICDADELFSSSSPIKFPI